MSKKIIVILLTLVLTMALVSGCSTYTDTDDKTEENVVVTDVNTEDTVGDSEDVDTTVSEPKLKSEVNVSGGVAITLNQFAYQSSNDSDAFYLLMTTLFRYYDGKIYNDGCEAYELSEDGLTYTFHLREGVNYTDGRPVTASDYLYALREVVKPDSGAANAFNYYNIDGAEAFSTGEGQWEDVAASAPDENTLILTLSQPDKAFIDILATSPLMPVREDFVNEWGEAFGSSPESILSSGPYILTEWTVDTSMTYVKNQDWWNAENEFPMEKINILDIDSPNTEISMFENKEIDVIDSVDPMYISTVEESIDSYESNTEMFLWVKEEGTSDEATALLDNDNFRKALTFALDRTLISGAVNAGFIGTNRAVSGNYPGIEGKYVDEYAVETALPEGDQAKAVEYLALAMEELGYSDVSQLPEMSYITFERDDMKLLGETIVDSWKQVLGIDNIVFVQYPIGTAIQQFYTGEYDFFMISLGCTVKPTEIIEMFAENGDFNFFTTNWATDITATLDEANALEFKSDAYFKKVAEAEESLLNEYSLVPLYNQTNYYALGDNVEGYVEPGSQFQFQFNQLRVTQ